VGCFKKVVMAICLGCLSSFSQVVFSETAQQGQASHFTIQVGIDLWPGYYPVILAKELGIFKKYNLDVNIILPEHTDNMLGDFVSGKLDVVCVAMGDAFTLLARDPDLRVVWVSDESAGGDALLSLKSLNSPNNTKPIKIGTNLLGFGEIFIERYLASASISKDNVVLVQQDSAQALAYLRDGIVDIAHAWEPYVTEVTQYLKSRIIFDSSQTPGLIPDTVLFNGKFRKNHPLQGKRFIAAWLEATQWWLNNREQGDAMLDSYLVVMPGSINLKDVKLYTGDNNKRAFTKADDMSSLYFVAQIYSDFFYKNGVLKKNINPESLLDSSFLP